MKGRMWIEILCMNETERDFILISECSSHDHRILIMLMFIWSATRHSPVEGRTGRHRHMALWEHPEGSRLEATDRERSSNSPQPERIR